MAAPSSEQLYGLSVLKNDECSIELIRHQGIEVCHAIVSWVVFRLTRACVSTSRMDCAAVRTIGGQLGILMDRLGQAAAFTRDGEKRCGLAYSRPANRGAPCYGGRVLWRHIVVDRLHDENVGGCRWGHHDRRDYLGEMGSSRFGADVDWI